MYRFWIISLYNIIHIWRVTVWHPLTPFRLDRLCGPGPMGVAIRRRLAWNVALNQKRTWNVDICIYRYAMYMYIYIYTHWGLPKPCISGWTISSFYEGNLVKLHSQLLQCLGRAQYISKYTYTSMYMSICHIIYVCHMPCKYTYPM